MKDKKRLTKSTNIRFFIAYFTLLLSIQAISIIYFLKHPTVINIIIIGLGSGLLLPIALGYLMIFITKVQKKENGN